jgi:flavin reductase (DIM6/NTAB) family NADH-FMN oxidoreductase RutF
MTDKVKVSSSSISKLLHPMHTVLVSCMGKNARAHIITLAWAMPTSINPPMVTVSITPRRYSPSLIEDTHEFVVNIPTLDILKETQFCGKVSGRDHDKFKETGLTPAPTRKVKPPIIRECVAKRMCCALRMHVVQPVSNRRPYYLRRQGG